MRKTLLAMLAMAVAATVPAIAGHGHEKCSYDTQACLNMMSEKMKNSGWIGVDLDKNAETGVLTEKKVIEGSPAEKAGLKTGDVLYAIDGIVLNDANQEKIKKAKMAWKPGTSISYTIKRDGQDRKAAITLAPMPADILAKYIGEHMLDHAAVEVAAK